MHPIQLRILAEDLVRRRAPDEARRYAAAQRRGRIDANPHQVNAVVFALERIEEGGCILADEVGLGKTIEAGLVMAQLLAEGARRILILVPKPLLGQWRNELYDLFGLDVHEVDSDPASLMGQGVFIAGREWAGGEVGSSLLRVTEPFDLCVIDEAHEIFANIHKRYDSDGHYREQSTQARMADRVRSATHGVPMLLLTATPIQNTLLELWGLVQYVEPTGTLLGDLPTFRALFCEDGGRTVAPSRVEELRRRVGHIVQRTLRRQAQPFLDQPFVDRRTRLFEYNMSDDERALYDDVTDYLLRRDTLAFDVRNRKLLLIGFHRRMASSLPALAASLETVVKRLERLRGSALAPGDEIPASEHADRIFDAALLEDFDGDLDDASVSLDDTSPLPEERSPEDTGTLPDVPISIQQRPVFDPVRLDEELAEVRGYAKRAQSLPDDNKAMALREAVGLIQGRNERQGTARNKVVIFTESLHTQDYLRRLLLEDGIDDAQITLFRGSNASPRADQALSIWQTEVAESLPEYRQPSRSIAMRLALVHEFKTRSSVFIATEAGAKGLNLQFCDTIVNYDLPWNPQRIEQRIGRCHRYGQTQDVTVINFLAADNEAQQLTFELLSQKLELFGEVLDASDSVLHRPGPHAPQTLAGSVGTGFEKALRDIYASARSRDDIAAELKALRSALDRERHAFEASVARTTGLIESHFDASVRGVFQTLQDELPIALRDLDKDMEGLTLGWLGHHAIPVQRMEAKAFIRLRMPCHDALPQALATGDHVEVGIGDTREVEGLDALHLEHPLFRSIVDDVRGESTDISAVRIVPSAVPLPNPLGADVPASSSIPMDGLRGRRGRMVLARVSWVGLQPVDHLVLTAAFEPLAGATQAQEPPISSAALIALVRGSTLTGSAPLNVDVDDEALDDALEEAVFVDAADVSERADARFERLMAQIERYVEDRIVVQRRKRVGLEQRLMTARETLTRASGPSARRQAESKVTNAEDQLAEVGAQIERLAARQDPDYLRWREHALTRRYTEPQIDRLLTFEFVVEP